MNEKIQFIIDESATFSIDEWNFLSDYFNKKKKKKEELPFLGHDEELKKLFDSPQKHIQIIGLYIKATHINLDNRDKVKSVIARNTRSASLLKGYKFSRIIETMKYLVNNADYKWTLETVGKFIDSDLTKINTFKEQPKKALGEFEV